MQVSDLIGIGRLGGIDAQGFFRALIKPRYRSAFKDLSRVYLIFTSDRVFYVSISERRESENKIMLRFAEDGVIEERRLHREVIIAIEPAALESDSGELDHVIGFEAVFEGRPLGEIIAYFHNNAQYVIVVKMPDGKELMVPWVDYYIQTQIADPGVVVLTNLEPLLAAME